MLFRFSSLFMTSHRMNRNRIFARGYWTVSTLELLPLPPDQLRCPLIGGFLDRGPTLCLYGGPYEPPPCCHRPLPLTPGHLQGGQGRHEVNIREAEKSHTIQHSCESWGEEAISSLQSEFPFTNQTLPVNILTVCLGHLHVLVLKPLKPGPI